VPYWLFIALFSAVAGFIAFNGFLMLFAPGQHRKFLAWFGRAESWSEDRRDESRGPEIQRRLAGGLMMLLGAYLLYQTLIRSILRR
jgi:hypothetical protein